MSTPSIDFLTAAIRSWRIAQNDAELARASTEALLAIAADVRRIADQGERPLEPVTAVLDEPLSADPWSFRDYLAREGRL